jgi:hypothetical protein
MSVLLLPITIKQWRIIVAALVHFHIKHAPDDAVKAEARQMAMDIAVRTGKYDAEGNPK